MQKMIDDMFAFLHKNNLEPKIGEVFSFADVKKACIMQDTGKISGKIIIKVE